MNPGLMALIDSGVSLPFRVLVVLVELPLVTLYFSPLSPSPSDFGLRSFFNFVEILGDGGGGMIGEEGGRSFS